MTFFNNKIKYIIFFLFTILLVLIDQLTKNLAKINLKNESPFVIIKNILELVYVENTGAAFGVFKGKMVLFYILTIIVVCAILYFLYKLKFNKYNLLYFVILVLIFSGAIGNFIDRVKNQFVVDFIYFKLIDFPVFNFADICITCGCIIMILSMFTIYKNDLL